MRKDSQYNASHNVCCPVRPQQQQEQVRGFDCIMEYIDIFSEICVVEKELFYEVPPISGRPRVPGRVSLKLTFLHWSFMIG